MIHVDRPSPAPEKVCEALAKPVADKIGKGKARPEIDLARTYYATKPRPKTAYEFEQYKAPEVCKALDAIFHEKCAYCESRYSAVAARDIEHFRPKGGIKEAPDHPGYWWLAMVWSNLLPSCSACNRRRKHVTFMLGMTLEEFERALLKDTRMTSGKGNSFPTENDMWVHEEDANLDVEQPLLIDPTAVEPNNHLQWVFDWDREDFLWDADPVIAAVSPRIVDGQEDLRGSQSVALYGLNRAGLFRERMERIRDMQRESQRIVDVIMDLSAARSATWRKKLGERLAKYKLEFHRFGNPDERYAGMSRAFLAEFDHELDRFAASFGRPRPETGHRPPV